MDAEEVAEGILYTSLLSGTLLFLSVTSTAILCCRRQKYSKTRSQQLAASVLLSVSLLVVLSSGTVGIYYILDAILSIPDFFSASVSQLREMNTNLRAVDDKLKACKSTKFEIDDWITSIDNVVSEIDPVLDEIDSNYKQQVDSGTTSVVVVLVSIFTLFVSTLATATYKSWYVKTSWRWYFICFAFMITFWAPPLGGTSIGLRAACSEASDRVNTDSTSMSQIFGDYQVQWAANLETSVNEYKAIILATCSQVSTSDVDKLLTYTKPGILSNQYQSAYTYLCTDLPLGLWVHSISLVSVYVVCLLAFFVFMYEIPLFKSKVRSPESEILMTEF